MFPSQRRAIISGLSENCWETMQGASMFEKSSHESLLHCKVLTIPTIIGKACQLRIFLEFVRASKVESTFCYFNVSFDVVKSIYRNRSTRRRTRSRSFVPRETFASETVTYVSMERLISWESRDVRFDVLQELTRTGNATRLQKSGSARTKTIGYRSFWFFFFFSFFIR